MKSARELRRAKGPRSAPVRPNQPSRGDAVLGQRLAELRQENELSQADVARELGLKSHTSVANIESGRALPSVRALARYAAFYEVSLDELCGHLVKAARSEEIA